MFYCFVLYNVMYCCDTTIRGEIKIIIIDTAANDLCRRR